MIRFSLLQCRNPEDPVRVEEVQCFADRLGVPTDAIRPVDILTERVDASALQAYDSSTIALLLQARRLAQAAGRGFEVIGAPGKLAELARLYGVEELLSLAPSSPAGPTGGA